ncbi:MAG: helix-turn-helix transcriptional regulator, partial [Martelella sp.]
MMESKIFAGPRLRRLRKQMELTQTAMAEALSISPSYLNLIERNQRPLTVQLLLKLAAVYDVDIASL